jgi:hypothetical protein
MVDPELDFDADESSVLSRAREGLSPTRSDQERVWQSIQARFEAPGGPGAPTGSSQPTGAAGLSGVLSRGSGWMSRLVVASAIAASAGAVGYWAGRRAGLRERRFATPAATHSTAFAPPAGPQGPAPTPSLQSEAAESAEAPPAAGRQARAAPGLLGAPRPDPARSSTGAARTSAAESLEKELSALRGVERALRDRQPSLALALLQELDRTVPSGKLAEEREATSAIARCELDAAPFGVDLAEDFRQRYPASVYLKRVEQSCASASDSKAARK